MFSVLKREGLQNINYRGNGGQWNISGHGPFWCNLIKGQLPVVAEYIEFPRAKVKYLFQNYQGAPVRNKVR